jgi:predicted aconitase
MQIKLSSFDKACLDGAHGEACRYAMEILLAVGRASGAIELMDIEQAHLVGSYESGPANLKFLDAMLERGAQVRVPTTLNASSACLSADSPSADVEVCGAREVVERYQAMGCETTLTCAPYHLPSSPRFGEAIAWAESNAVAYANSVIGARTNKTPQYLDLCAAICGRIPASGLYLEENRFAQLVIDCSGVTTKRWQNPFSYQLLGLLIGALAQSQLPVLTGIPTAVDEDDLRAIGAGGASSGNVAMFHVEGRTPEAPDLKTTLGGIDPEKVCVVTDADFDRLRDQYGVAEGAPVSAVCLGTPHFSYREFKLLLKELNTGERDFLVPMYVTTSRHVKAKLERELQLAELVARGVQVVTDSCSYYGHVVPGLEGTVMTNSSKWAFYGSGNLEISTCLASLEDCVATARRGKISRRGAA